MVLLQFAGLLEYIQIFDGDLPARISLGCIHIFVEQALDFRVLKFAVVGDDDVDGAVEVFEVGESFWRKGEAVVLRQVETQGMVPRDVVKSAEKVMKSTACRTKFRVRIQRAVLKLSSAISAMQKLCLDA